MAGETRTSRRTLEDGFVMNVPLLALATLLTGQVIEEFPLPDRPDRQGWARELVAGPDENLWFTVPNANQVGKMSPAGFVTLFRVPTPDSRPFSITVGPDGNLWFTEDLGRKIGRITTDGEITEFPIPDLAVSGICGISTGPDGNLWFPLLNGQSMGRLTPDGSFSRFYLPGPRRAPMDVAACDDGFVYFTDFGENAVGRVDRSGSITIETLGGKSAVVGPTSMTIGPDGRPWFTVQQREEVGRIGPDGKVTWLRSSCPNGNGLVAGPDGNLWIADTSSRRVVRLTPRGEITEYRPPSDDFRPFKIAVGPDRNLWFSSMDSPKIGRLRLDPRP